MAPFTDVPGAPPSTPAVVSDLTTRGLSTSNAVSIAFGLATFVLGVLSILLTWQLARRRRRVVREPTGAGLDDQETGDMELQRLTQPGDGLQLQRHSLVSVRSQMMLSHDVRNKWVSGREGTHMHI